MLRPIVIRVGILLTALFVAISTGMIIATLIRSFYQVRVDLNILKIQMAQEKLDRQNLADMLRGELNDIYRTLYAPPDTKTPERRQSQVELWQINRDLELRRRIEKLEQWRLTAPRPKLPDQQR